MAGKGIEASTIVFGLPLKQGDHSEGIGPNRRPNKHFLGCIRLTSISGH